MSCLEKNLLHSNLGVCGDNLLFAGYDTVELAKKHGKKVIAFAGCVTDEARLCNAAGIDAFFPILRRPSTLAEAMDPDAASRNLADTAEQAFRLIKMMKG